MENQVDTHLRNYNLDLRKSRNGRFMDQKVTPDNLALICDSIRNFVGGEVAKPFTINDVWDSGYFRQTVMDVYSKPDPTLQAQNEYNKFVGQPIKLLAYAGILIEQKIARGYVYSVSNFDLLEFIALSQMNALKFLDKYLTKVLLDSGELQFFNQYEALYTKGIVDNSDFIELRDRYVRFIRGNTDINGILEPRRIFNKVINILAVQRRIPGSKSGRITPYPFIYKDLEYNNVNWRDLNKRKDLTRKQANLLHSVDEQVEKISNYEMSKAKTAIKKRHLLSSEVKDSLANSDATQVHHMFPDSTFPVYRATLENLILLTASQHNERAHPLNNTHIVDAEYQRACLMAKLDSIEESQRLGDDFYSLEVFISMLNDIKSLDIEAGASINMVKDKLSHY
jgi:hypothetical protein